MYVKVIGTHKAEGSMEINALVKYMWETIPYLQLERFTSTEDVGECYIIQLLLHYCDI